MMLLLLLTNVAFFAAAAPGSLEAMKKDVQKIVEARSKKWNCSFSIAIKTPAIPGPALTFVAGGEEKGELLFMTICSVVLSVCQLHHYLNFRGDCRVKFCVRIDH